MTEAHRALAAYLRQQAEGDAPDIILPQDLVSELSSPRPPAPAPAAVESQPRSAGTVLATADKDHPKPLRDLHKKIARRVVELGAEDVERREELKKLYFETQACEKCPLAGTRRSVVFGAGSVTAPVLVIGEAPGADEDAQGLPFVGRAGKLLTDMLNAIGLDRDEDVFITNVLKCRPPGNRNPESTEIQQCLPILQRQVEILQPKVILLLGRTATSTVLERHEGIGKLRGEEHEYRGIPAFVTYHPAALLRNQGYKRPAWEDLKRLSAKLKELGTDGSAAT